MLLSIMAIIHKNVYKFTDGFWSFALAVDGTVLLAITAKFLFS